MLGADEVRQHLIAAGVTPDHVTPVRGRTGPVIVVFLHGTLHQGDIALEILCQIDGVAEADFAKNHAAKTILHVRLLP